MSAGQWIIQAAYFIAAILFIVGLKGMSSPRRARRGFYIAGIGMLTAVIATFFLSGVGGTTDIILILIALGLGGSISWIAGKRVPITAMPQMVALYNGMGGGAAAAIAAHALVRGEQGTSEIVVAVVGALIGAVSFSGSLIAFAKLQGWMRAWRFPYQNFANAGALVAVALFAALAIIFGNAGVLVVFFLVALALGVLVTVPVGGADMPVMISLYNAMTGLAVGFEGYVFGNPAMIVAGMIVGAAGSLLTYLMAKGMNRSLANVLFAGFGETAIAGGEIEGELKAIEANDAAAMMAYAGHVIIAPGYGMAVAQAQHKLWEFVKLLRDKGVKVSFAIHPVAGRMPGHMNVLLAEAGVPYDLIHDLDEINEEFVNADVALVIGANDVVNPAARENKSSPIYGMPILNVDRAQNVIVCKRGQGRGFAGIENELFYRDNTRMLYGDAQETMGRLIQSVKSY
ncbi:MAG TPA: NAD(P)(+) transhydrogenase (Re/Si-specific) subunit beta [Gammaproteobacteria bacterium]|nr:NAD(P)(+) transhydrogenase (Re/Si-specific) subunit beta [Gammaproteobacteria bacterium]